MIIKVNVSNIVWGEICTTLPDSCHVHIELPAESTATNIFHAINRDIKKRMGLVPSDMTVGEITIIRKEK